MPTARSQRVLRLDLEFLLFFLAYYLCVWLLIDPRLIYHSLGIFTPYPAFAFETRWQFFFDHLARAGGTVEYAANLLTTFYGLGWVGALIITGVAFCLGLFAKRLSRHTGWHEVNALGYVVAAAVLFLHSDYGHPLRFLLALLASLGSFSLYVRFAPQPPVKRTLVLVLMFVFLYHIATAGSLLFPVLVAMDELLLRRQRTVAVVAVSCALLGPWALGTLFGLEMKDAYAGFLISNPGISPRFWHLTLALCLFFPIGFGVCRLLPRIPVRAADPAESKRQPGTRPDSQPSPRSFLESPRTRRVIMILCSCGIAALAWLLSNSFVRTVLEMDYYSQQEQWTETLRAAERVPNRAYNVRCARNVLLALCQSGQLGDKMCHYNLTLNSDLLYTPERHRDLGSHFQESRILLALGQVNEAERCAYEALELSGPQPAILQQLATINMAKGRTETAVVFLNALALQPLHRRTARALLQSLQEHPDMKNLPQIQQIRANMIRRDRVVRHTRLEQFFQALLDENPRNRMAFDLLMAHYLSSRQIDKVAENLPRLKEFGDTTAPRHFQEAWVIATGWPNTPPPIPGFEIDP